jgi:uncharacterized protein (TIGR03086 family)
MSEVDQRYAAVAAGFTVRLRGVGPGSWSAPTPCPEWTVRDLVAHVIATQRRVLAMVDGSEPADGEPDGDLHRQWLAASGAVTEAVGDDSRAGTVVRAMSGEQTFASLVGRLLCTDTLVHTWDLARATGQDETLDPDAVAKARESLTPLDETIRRPGGFGPKIAPSPSADAQTQFLNFCGRAP